MIVDYAVRLSIFHKENWDISLGSVNELGNEIACGVPIPANPKLRCPEPLLGYYAIDNSCDAVTIPIEHVVDDMPAW